MTVPDRWLIKPLAEVAQVVMGQSPDSKYYSEEEVGLPFLQGCAEFQGRHPKHAIYCSHSKKIGCAGSILLSVRAPVGRLNVANRDYVIGRGLASLNGTRVTQHFLEHFLVFQEPMFGLASQGSTFEAINSSELKQWPILHPKDKAEQAKIAEVLSTVDRAIEETEALIAKQQRIKTGLTQDLLTRGIDEHGNLRSEQIHKFKDSRLGRIPVAWAVSSIGAEFDIQLGKMLSQASRQSRTPLPYLGNKNVQWDNVDLTNLERMDFDEGERKKFRLKSGDILVCEGGEVGRTCVWREELEECFYQKAIHRLRPKRGYFPSLFPTYMRWAVRNGLLSDFTSQSSIAHLTKEKLAGVPMCVPSESEQMRISGAMEAIDRGLAIHRQQLAKLRALKHGLMQHLLTGNRRVTALLEQRDGVTA